MKSSSSDGRTDGEFDVHVALRSGRLELAEYLDRLDSADWTLPSLSEGWTIADVVAHLTLSTSETWRQFIVGMVKNFGNFDRWNAANARGQAQRHAPSQLVALLRANADSREHGPGSSHLDQLVDLLVHGQDISRATDAPFGVPVAPAVAALDHAVRSRWYGAGKRFAGIRLSATDAAWTFGEGSEVRGSVTALLLLATGRPAGLPEVAGPGVDTLRTRLASDDITPSR